MMLTSFFDVFLISKQFTKQQKKIYIKTTENKDRMTLHRIKQMKRIQMTLIEMKQNKVTATLCMMNRQREYEQH